MAVVIQGLIFTKPIEFEERSNATFVNYEADAKVKF